MKLSKMLFLTYLFFEGPCKYLRDSKGQRYELYKLEDENCSFDYSHLNKLIELYEELLGRPSIPSDPLFSRFYETVTTIYFGEKIFQASFMKNDNFVVSS